MPLRRNYYALRCGGEVRDMRGADLTKTERARRLRREPTDAEKKLWYRIRARSLGGHKFVRQEPIGPYVVDFVCREEHLVIEVDGGQHATDPRDAVRDRWLAEHRYRVLRFWNNEVLANIAGGLLTIDAAVNADRPPTPDLESELCSPRTPPLRGGRGEARTADDRALNSTSVGRNPASVLPAPVGAISSAERSSRAFASSSN